jgi:preprotein translocase subunit SecG
VGGGRKLMQTQHVSTFATKILLLTLRIFFAVKLCSTFMSSSGQERQKNLAEEFTGKEESSRKTRTLS